MSQTFPQVGQLSPDRRWRWDGGQWLPAPDAYFARRQTRRPPWAAFAVRVQPDAVSFALITVVAIFTDQALRAAAAGLAASLALATAALMPVINRRVANRQAYAAIALSVAFAICLSVRESPWLAVPDLVVAIGLAAVGASLGVRGSVFDLAVAETIARSAQGLVHLAGVPAFLRRGVPSLGPGQRQVLPLLRGVLIGAPVVVVIALLLAAADPIFASFFQLNVDFWSLALDGIYLALAAWAAAALLSVASAEPLPAIEGLSWRLGDTEAIVVVVLLDAVFALFAVSQAIGASGAGAATLRASGVTFADYARSGFFQLLWVAGITLVLLAVLKGVSTSSGRRARLTFTALSELAVVFTLPIVFVASRRLSLYEAAYGFTMLRLYSHIFAIWIGAVFIVLGVVLTGVRPEKSWFLGAASAVGVAVLLALNVLNPEALVVHQNLDRYQATHKIDTDYLSQLSDDATPALVGGVPALDSRSGASIHDAVCARHGSSKRSWAALNLSSIQADSARRHC